MCCCLSAEPAEDKTGRLKTFNGKNRFQTGMLTAPCYSCPWTGIWFCGQCIPFTCGITQFCLRRKVLNYDMTKYVCFQGYFDCCCCKAGSCCESTCPSLCLCCEAHCCNFLAVSASRLYVMEKFDLTSDPCDYRLIRLNNLLQCLACLCRVLAMFSSVFNMASRIVDLIADIVYHCVSGCMTAQVTFILNLKQTAHEVNYQISIGNVPAPVAGGKVAPVNS